MRKVTNRTLARQIKRIYKVMEYFGFETGAFSQLTRNYMTETFNPKTPDVDGVRLVQYQGQNIGTTKSLCGAGITLMERR